MNNQEEKEFTGDLAVLLDQVRDFYEKWKNRPGLGVVISVADDEVDGVCMQIEGKKALKNVFDPITKTEAYKVYAAAAAEMIDRA